MGQEIVHDAWSGLAVAEDVGGSWAEPAGQGIGEVVVDGVGGGPGEDGLAGVEGFGAVGLLPGDDSGHTEEGGFFLDAAGIGEDGAGGVEEGREGIRGEWGEEDEILGRLGG